ncbi:MAG: hypothetical protein ACK50S_00655 [bacterium]
MAKKGRVTSPSLADSERWRVEDDLRICIECEKIEADPKRYAKVKALAKEKMLDVAAIAAGSEC